MTLRVTGGELSGRLLKAPKGIRPSQSMVKEAIFNALATRLEGAGVIDLFAGSGALGIEALSRGARHATFVERDPGAARILRQNLEATGCLANATLAVADAVRWLDANPTAVETADIVLLDPPYAEPSLEAALRKLDARVKGVVVAELSSRQEAPALQRLEVRRDRRYGDARVVFLEPRP